MALREFTDSQGRAWRAWDVPPHRVYPRVRAEKERRVRAIPDYQPERRVGAERRRRKASLSMERGWVCFESGEEKRRIAPPPPGWAEVEEGELEALCRTAPPAARSA